MELTKTEFVEKIYKFLDNEDNKPREQVELSIVTLMIMNRRISKNDAETSREERIKKLKEFVSKNLNKEAAFRLYNYAKGI
jgi:hypothetical protein